MTKSWRTQHMVVLQLRRQIKVLTCSRNQSATVGAAQEGVSQRDKVGKRKNLGWMGCEGGAEAGLLQRDVDELLVRKAGAQAAAGSGAAHFSSEVVCYREQA